MERIIEVCGDQDFSFATLTCKVLPLDASVLHHQAPSAHFLFIRDDQLLGRCSIWTTGTPVHQGSPIGVIGHYAAADASAGIALLHHAADELRQRGYSMAAGPMDGNTWRRYRLLTRRGDEPLFFLEPDNPDDWPGHFQAAGFAPLARYFSALNSDLSITDPRVPEAEARLRQAGITLRTIDDSRFEAELKAVHELSLEAFAGNFLYTPISQEEFLAMYAPLQPHLRRELIILAEREGRLEGFIFGFPDLAQAKRGEPITSAIAKSMAVRPGKTGGGLGSVLMDRFHQTARKLGFSRVIHALMHENNHSLRISSRFGKPFRQYTLYSKELAP